MNTLKIAICQILALDGDRAGNFVRIENALRQAARAHAQIACFPETALLGWVNPDAHDRAHPIPGADTDRLAALARKYDTYIYMIRRDPACAQRLRWHKIRFTHNI